MYTADTQSRKILRLCAVVLLILAVMWLLLFQRLSGRRTYVITDGSRVMLHTTAATDPKAVLGEAGLELGEDDSYTAQTQAGMAQINIRRGQTLILDYYGQEMEIVSLGETVEEVLTRLNFSWAEDDAISFPLDTKVYDGMHLVISRVVRENQVYTKVLPHETIFCSDDALPEGTQKVLTEGEDGQVLCEATVTYLNGIESERAVLSQQVISQPVNEVIALGTGTHQEEVSSAMAVIDEATITLPTGEVLTYGEKFTCLATAYTCEGYVGTTATGTRARVGAIAVDPEVFPYGTRFYIVTKDGEYIYGVATAEDCGSKEFIYGTRLDLYFNTRKECIQFGARSCDVYVLG